MTTLLRYTLPFVLPAALLLAACSSDDAPQTGGEAPLEDARMQLTRVARAPLLTTDEPDIHVYFLEGDQCYEGTFAHSDTGWKTQVKVPSGRHTFTVYGFAPATAGGTLSDGVLHLPSLDAVTATDYCVVGGVGKPNDSFSQAMTVTEGSYIYRYDSQVVNQDQTRVNYIIVRLDHLYAKLRFSLTLGEQYSGVRQIRLRSMRLEADTSSRVDADVTLVSGGAFVTTFSPIADAAPVSYPLFTESDSDASAGTDDLFLSTDQPLVAEVCVAPSTGLTGSLRIVSTYDVYDADGQEVVRSNCTSTNKLSQVLSSVHRGEEHLLRMVVEPSYLYQLTDDDANPEIHFK